MEPRPPATAACDIMKSSGRRPPRAIGARCDALGIVFGGGCPGPAGAVWRWNFTYVHRHFRCTHLAVENREHGQCQYIKGSKTELTTWVAAVAREAGSDTLVAGLLGGGGSRGRGRSLASVIWGSRRGGLLRGMAFVYVSRQQVTGVRKVTITKTMEQDGGVVTFARTGPHNADICTAGLRCLYEKNSRQHRALAGCWSRDEGIEVCDPWRRIFEAERATRRLSSPTSCSPPPNAHSLERREKRLTRAHMPCDMLWPGEGGVAYRTLGCEMENVSGDGPVKCSGRDVLCGRLPSVGWE